MRWLLSLALIFSVGCAKANVGGKGDDDGGDDAPSPDAPDNPLIDAPDVDIDAPPPPPDSQVSETLQQTQNNTITAANSVACGNGTTTSENSWYRVFALPDHNINSQFNVTQVTFAVQESAGSPAAQVKIGTYTGAIGAATINLAQITPLNAATVTVPPTTTGVSVPVPITATIPAGSQFVVEVFAPDLSATASSHVYIGATTSAETANRPSYIRAPAAGCAINNPTRVGDIGFPNAHAIITVTGTH